ncbi:MAG: hypothetical protein ACREJQ_02255, partial [bacterium]
MIRHRSRLAIVLTVLNVALFGLAGYATPNLQKAEGPPPGLVSSSVFLDTGEANAAKQRWMNTFAITAGFTRFIQAELRNPRSLEEVCGSPYMPVSCDHLKNPYTGARIANKIASPGDVYIDTSIAGITVSHYWTAGGNLSIWVADFSQDLSDALGSWAKGRKNIPFLTVRPLSYNERLANSVGKYVKSVLDSYILGQHQYCPSTLTLVRQWN